MREALRSWDDDLRSRLAARVIIIGYTADLAPVNYLFALQQQVGRHTVLQCIVTTADVG